MGRCRRLVSSGISLMVLLAACSSEGPTPPLEPQPLHFTTIAVSNENSCGLTDDGTAYCWGGNTFGAFFGETALPDCAGQQFSCTTRPFRIASPVPLIAISMNSSFGSYACGLDPGGAPYCWGTMLVDADQGHVFGEHPVALSGGVSLATISTGVEHICGVAATHEAYCWGDFEGGRRGDPTIGFDTSYATFDPNVVGGNLLFAQVAAGSTGTCGLTTEGQAFCWGSNAFGALGDPSASVQQECGLARPPCAPGPVPVANGQQFTEISGASGHICARTAGGAIWCWGQNDASQIGTAAQTTELCGDLLLLCVRQPELVFAPNASFASVSAGGGSTCGVDPGGLGYCWGDNSSGQIGNGGGAASVPVAVLGSHHFTRIAVAADHACGLTTEGEALCWGQNASGQLGTGDLQDANEPVAVVGPAAD
jgi:alpha-tubulin suppressor-like RCC1 family protein